MPSTDHPDPAGDAVAPRRQRRRPWIWLAPFLAVLGMLGLCEWRGWPFLKGPIEKTLERRLQRPIDLGSDFRLHLVGSIRVDTDTLRIGPPQWQRAGTATPDTVSATDAHLAVPYGTVMGLMRPNTATPPHISALRFGRVDAALTRDTSGRANWSLAPAPAADNDQRRAVAVPTVGELVIQSGRVTLDDALTRLRMDATVSTDEGQGAQAGTGAKGLLIDGRGAFRDQDFGFHVKSSGLLPLVAPSGKTAVPIDVRANVGKTKGEFNGTGSDLLKLEGLDGQVAVSGPSLAQVGDMVGVTVPTTSPFSLKGHLTRRGDLWSMKVGELNVGSSRLAGAFDFDKRPAVPLLSGELTGPRLALADLLPAFGAPPVPGAKVPTAAPGRVLPDKEFDIPSLRAMNANVKLRLQHADLGSLFAEPLQPLEGDIDLHSGVLRVANLEARAAGGELHGDISLDPKTPAPQWHADLRWSGIQLDRWLRPRNERAKEGTVPAGRDAPGYVSGQLKGHAQLRGQGASTARLLASLDGTVETWIADGRISHLVVEAIGLDVARVLGIMVTGDNPLPMQCAVTRLKATNGKVVPETAIIDTPASTVLVSGTMSLVDEKLALTLNARPKDVSPLSLRTPVHVEGTFSDPQVKLDANPLGLKVLASVALAAVNPLAALIPLVDVGDSGTSGCAQTLQRLRGGDAPPAAKPAAARGAGNPHAAP